MAHSLNRRTLAWLIGGSVVVLAILLAAVVATPASAHRSQGFEPSDELLACIRSYEGAYDSDTGNGYHGAYQFDVRTWRSGTAPISDEHFAHWSSPRTDHADDAHPMIQDEAARNVIRARGLQPWPTPSRRCQGR